MIRSFVFLSVMVCAAIGWGEDRLTWPQFRGSNGSGVADDQRPPVEIGPEKNVKWKVAVPKGLSSPIIAGDKLVVTGFEDGTLYTIAYRRADGKEAWRADARADQMERFNNIYGSPASSTPATDGSRVVSYFGSRGLICYDLSGKELWRHELPAAGPAGDFGSGVSPIIVDGTVILVRDTAKNAKIIALDVITGSPKWEKARQSPASYCTPVVWETASGKLVVAAGHARMIAYDLNNGSEKWSLTGMPSSCCASPVIADGTLFFAGSSSDSPEGDEEKGPTFDDLLKDLDKDQDGALSREESGKAGEGFFDSQDQNQDGKIARDEWDSIMKFFAEGKSSAFALKSGGTGDITDSHILWNRKKGLPYIASGLAYRGQYVTVKDGGIVAAIDPKTGKDIYLARVAAPGTYYASPVAANGHIYLTSLDDGVVTVIKAGSDKPEVVARNPKLGERVAATPAIAGHTLYIRTDGHLYAFSHE